MASSEWLAIYRTYSGDELTEEIASLKRQAKNFFQSMGVGSKNNTRSTVEIRDRLNAATRVLAERGRGGLTPMERGDWGVPDFSNVKL